MNLYRNCLVQSTVRNTVSSDTTGACQELMESDDTVVASHLVPYPLPVLYHNNIWRSATASETLMTILVDTIHTLSLIVCEFMACYKHEPV